MQLLPRQRPQNQIRSMRSHCLPPVLNADPDTRRRVSHLSRSDRCNADHVLVDFKLTLPTFFFGILIVQVMSEYASIKDAFGIVSLSAAQEPPIFRGQVGEIHSARHKNMTQTIATSNPHPVGASSCGVPGAGHCVGAGSRELERCPAGVSCPACARVHPIEMSPSSHWSSVPRGTKIEILWLLIKDALESDLFLILSVLFVVYLLKF